MSYPSISRRALFPLAASVGLTLFARRAHADVPEPETPSAPEPPTSAPVSQATNPSGGNAKVTSRVTRVSADERGVTVFLELEHAPFPAAGSWHRDPTVLVFVPRHHRPASGGTHFVVHFHGHNSSVERATVAHQLREQLYDSKQNAILVVPELAVMTPDSAAGKLELPGAFTRMLDDVLTTLATREARNALGASAPGAFAQTGRVCISAHSGGYHAAACAIRNGGAPSVHEVYLFDALYADTDVFRDWVIAGRGRPMASRHKLVSYYTAGSTEANTRRLFSDLEQRDVRVAREEVEGLLSREELIHAEAVSIRTQLAHGTVTSELNSLRDCLYASALRRRLRTSWFDAKQGARPLERRR